MVKDVLDKVEVGYRTETNNHGWLTVVEKLSSMELVVKFDNTGHEQCVHLANLRKNFISDQSLSLKSTFIDKAESLYGKGRFDYSNVVYKNRDTLVNIYCNEHSLNFTQAPVRHLKGQTGCPSCSERARSTAAKLTTADFISKSLSLHGTTYDYSKSVYEGNNEEVVIVCPIHGEFLQKPAVHWMGCGCPICANKRTGEAQTKTLEEFLVDARSAHGTRYDYSLVEYEKAVNKIKIICPEHGVFLQAPIAHICGRGCQKCAKSGFNEHKPGLVYILDNGHYIKVGITNKSVEHRVRQINNTAPFKFWSVFSLLLDGVSCKRVEKQMHHWLASAGYKQTTDRFIGWTECFVGPSISEVVNKLCATAEELNG